MVRRRRDSPRPRRRPWSKPPANVKDAANLARPALPRRKLLRSPQPLRQWPYSTPPCHADSATYLFVDIWFAYAAAPTARRPTRDRLRLAAVPSQRTGPPLPPRVGVPHAERDHRGHTNPGQVRRGPSSTESVLPRAAPSPLPSSARPSDGTSVTASASPATGSPEILDRFSALRNRYQTDNAKRARHPFFGCRARCCRGSGLRVSVRRSGHACRGEGRSRSRSTVGGEASGAKATR